MKNPTNSYLLDTHILIWWFLADKRLSKKLVDLLEDKSNSLFISSVSLHEFAIKDNLGQMPISSLQLQKACQKTNIEVLVFNYADMSCLASLPKMHADPFDRALIAQALTNRVALISADSSFDQYQRFGLQLNS